MVRTVALEKIPFGPNIFYLVVNLSTKGSLKHIAKLEELCHIELFTRL